MPDLTPTEASLGQCCWAVIGSVMDNDQDATRYLLSGLTETELGAVIATMARMVGSMLTAAYGPEDGRRVASAKAVEYAQAAGE